MSLVSGPGFGGVSRDSAQSLYTEAHVKYVVSLDKRSDEYEYWLTEHLRLNGIYWGLVTIHLLQRPTALPRDGLIDFVLKCWHPESGGFGAAPGHDHHILHTCSAIQILAMADALDVLDEPAAEGESESKKTRIGKFISSLQDRKSGTFHGDEYGEPDTRFLYAALNSLSLLGLLDLVDVSLAISHIESCANPDGGYGTVPGAESHSGQIFVCLAALSIAGVLESKILNHPEKADRLAAWLSERQITSGPGIGGLNGRPEKQEDVCYSWWVVTCLAMLKRVHWIDRPALRRFILRCQDEEHGGISDRPGDAVDVFHTCFAIAGLSLLEWDEKKAVGAEMTGFGLSEIDPVYCLPRDITRKILCK